MAPGAGTVMGAGVGGGGRFIAKEYVRECMGCGGGGGAECEWTACGREPVCE